MTTLEIFKSHMQLDIMYVLSWRILKVSSQYFPILVYYLISNRIFNENSENYWN